MLGGPLLRSKVLLKFGDPIVQLFFLFLKLLDRLILLDNAQGILLDYLFDHELPIAKLANFTSGLLFSAGDHGFWEGSALLEAIFADCVPAELAVIFCCVGLDSVDDAGFALERGLFRLMSITERENVIVHQEFMFFSDIGRSHKEFLLLRFDFTDRFLSFLQDRDVPEILFCLQ